jgi:hypothetical protein
VGASQTPVLTQVGYPDFWPVVFRKHERFFLLAQSFGPIIDEVFGIGMGEPMHKICRHLAKSVGNSVCAVMLLGANGFGVDALKIGRCMFEAAVTVAYLRQHPEEFQDYFDFHFLVAERRHYFMARYAPQLLDELTPEAFASTRDSYARVVSRYTNKKGKVRSRWGKRSFSAMCVELGLQELYLSFYDLASHIIHADISGVMAQADPEPGVLDVDIAPSEQFVEMALRTAHYAFVLATSEYIAMARPEKQSVAAQLDKGFVAAWG